MKKLLAILTSVILLVSSLTCGIVMTTAEEAATPDGYFFDYSTEESYKKLLDPTLGGTGSTSGGITYAYTDVSVSYDATNAALKATATGNSPTLKWQYDNNKVQEEKCAVFAVKMKLADTTSAFYYTWLSQRSSFANNKNALKSVPTYQATTEWQLVVIDVSKTNWQSDYASDGNYWRLVQMGLDQGATKKNGTYYIQWAGFFTTQDNAQAYYAATTPSDEPVDPSTYLSKFFFDFSSQTSYDTLVPGASNTGGTTYGSTGVAYDSTNSALKALPTANQPYLTFTAGWKNVPMETHTVVAMKVKLTNANTKFGYLYMSETGGAPYYTLKSYPQYEATTGWQLVLVDISAENRNSVASPGDGNWRAIRYYLEDVTLKSDIYIQWAGIFTSTENAQAYYAATTPTDDGDGDGDGSGDSGDEEEGPSKYTKDFFFDYSTEAGYNKQGPNGSAGVGVTSAYTNAELSYDARNAAMKATATGGSPALKWTYNGSPTKADDCGVFAMKIKLSSRTSQFYYYWMSQNGNFATNKTTFKTMPKYEKTTKWQLVVIDVSESNWDSYAEHDGNWRVIQLGLAEGASPNVDSYYIQWAGLFANAEAAQAYYTATENTTGGAGGDDSDDSDIPANGKSDFYYSYETEEDFNKNVGQELPTAAGENIVDTGRSDAKYTHKTFAYEWGANAGGNTVLSYDPEQKAMKLVAKADYDPNTVFENKEDEYDYGAGTMDWRFQIGKIAILPENDMAVSMGQYPYLALKVKLASADYTYASPNTMVATNANASMGFSAVTSSKGYEATTDWQLLIIEVNGKSTNWKGIMLSLVANKTPVKAGQELAWIQWAGAFSTKEAAQAHFLGIDVGDLKDEADYLSDYFFSLNSEAEINAYIANNAMKEIGNNTLSYDAEQKAMKLTAVNDYDGTGTEEANQVGMVRFLPIGNVGTASFAEYPYFAIKVKLADANTKYGRVLAAHKGIGSGYIDPGSVISAYNGSDDWQVVIVQATNSLLVDDWKGVKFDMAAIGTTAKAGDTIGWIEWAGAFASVSDIWDYAGINPDAVEAPTPIFWDFGSSSTVNYEVRTNGDTAISYDGDLKAMKVEVSDANGDGMVTATPASITLGSKMPIEEGIKMEDYPIFALRVKLADRELAGGMLSIVSTASEENVDNGDIDSSSVDVATLKYKKTTNWQTVIVDYTSDNPFASLFLGGDWVSIDIDMLSDAIVMGGETVYVKWAGAFASMEDVEAFVAKTAANETGNDDIFTGDEEDNDTNDDNTGDSNEDSTGNTEQEDSTSPDTGESVAATLILLALAAVAAAVVLLTGKKRRTQNT